jgi:pimeloyl-ACP methyl ester carboxylesterase
VDRAHLVGESIGGTVVLNAALRMPMRVQSVTVSNGAHLGASIRSVADWERMIREDGMGAWSAFMMRGRFHPGAISAAQHDWFAAQQATACPDAVLRLLNALVGSDLSERLLGLQPRLLLMHPDDSPFIPVPVMVALRDLVPRARLHVMGNARHGLPFSHAPLCAQIFAGFLAEA